MAEPNAGLSDAEKRLVDCAEKGEWWEPLPGDGMKPEMDPAKAAQWDQSRVLGAKMICCLATGDVWPGNAKPWPVSSKGLMVRGAHISGPLDLEGATVPRTLWLRRCAFDDPITLRDAETRTINLQGSLLSQRLNANRVVVKGSLLLRDGFTALDEVNLYRATVMGNLRCERSTFANSKGDAIDLTLAEIGAALFVRALKRPLEGRLVLSQAKCRVFSDDIDSWPESGKLVLDGFTYERFHECATDWETRKKWLLLQDPGHIRDSFRPQPWIQASKVLREQGHDDDARELAMQREIMRAKSRGTRWHLRLWLRILRWTIGNGYKPQRALFWSLGFFLFSWLVFATAANLGFMAPRDGSVQAYLAGNKDAKLPAGYTRFNAAVYALDTYLPIIELGQDQTWEPSDVQTGARRNVERSNLIVEATRLALGHDWCVTGQRDMRRIDLAAPKSTGPSAARQAPPAHIRQPVLAATLGPVSDLVASTFRLGFHRFVYWMMDLLGWVFVSLYIAGMSGVMKNG